MQAITPSAFRRDIYNLLDKVINTGVPIEIKRKGKVLRIINPEKVDVFSNMKQRDILNCDPEEITHIDWSKEWKPNI